MIERYLDGFARLLVEYSLRASEGDEALVVSTIEAKPLVREVVRELASRGAYPIVIFYDEEIEEVFYKFSTHRALSHTSKIDRDLMEVPSARLSIVSSTHARHLVTVDPDRIRIRRAAMREIMEIFNRRDEEGTLRWCVTLYPTKALAQEASMSLTDFEELVVRACMLDRRDPAGEWMMLGERMNAIVRKLERYRTFRITHRDGTDITLEVDKTRRWIVDDGRKNMPGGEIFTAPVEESVEGIVVFPGVHVHRGIIVRDVKLKLRGGVIVEAHASEGESYLRKIVDVDEGSKRIGELGVGMNYEIARKVNMVLIDEKIGGTIHLAIGMAYRGCGGKNESAVHWDLIKDMRDGGRIYADGELIYENGRFTI